MRALAGGSGEEANIFRVRVMRQGVALEEGEVAGLGEELGLLVEDIMQVVEAGAEEEQEEEQAEEPEEKPQQQGQEEPGRGPGTHDRSAPAGGAGGPAVRADRSECRSQQGLHLAQAHDRSEAEASLGWKKGYHLRHPWLLGQSHHEPTPDVGHDQ
eukprot:bmy_17529T0